METLTFAVLAAFLFGFGLISGRIGKSVITPPMAFVAMGLVLGPQLIGLIELDRDSELINLVAEFTLILLLFTDASRIDLKLPPPPTHDPDAAAGYWPSLDHRVGDGRRGPAVRLS